MNRLMKAWAFTRLFLVFSVMLLGFLLFERGFRISSQTTGRQYGSFYKQQSYWQHTQIPAVGQSGLIRIIGKHFPLNRTVYFDGIVYDFYSIGELGKLRPASQWLTFPLPDEINSVMPWLPKSQSTKVFPFHRSPKTKSSLAYVDKIYVISDPLLNDRHKNIKRMFIRHNLPINSIHWRLGRWNRATCTAKENKKEVYRTLNLQDGPLGDESAHRYCALTMKHVEIWQEIANSSSMLSLILEDDAVFVPFFKEKFDRFVYTAIRTGALKTNPTQCASMHDYISTNEWIEQDPAFVIGSCVGLHDPSFQSNISNAPPLLSTHKEKFSRCAHAYLLTSCSARALLHQLQDQKHKFLVVDWLQSYLARLSPTLQPFWLDPSIVYQGNMVSDLDGIPSFRRSTP